MAGRPDLDLYNVLLGFGWVRERAELLQGDDRSRLPAGAPGGRCSRCPLVDRPRPVDPAGALPPLRSRPCRASRAGAWPWWRAAGAGACVSLIGVRRAFEEAGIEPALICGCSGGTMWGSMWAGGMTADEMAEFSLSWRLEDYLDVPVGEGPALRRPGAQGIHGPGEGRGDPAHVRRALRRADRR
jgi:hypothetical protein